jgi:hypothetical protein
MRDRVTGLQRSRADRHDCHGQVQCGATIGASYGTSDPANRYPAAK